MELDNVYPEINPGEFIQFQRNLYLKLWEWIAGEKRMVDEKLRGKNKGRVLYRTRLPKYCKGSLIRLGQWDLKEREFISNLHVTTPLPPNPLLSDRLNSLLLSSLFSVFLKLLTAKETIYLINLTSWDYHRGRKTAITEEIENYLMNRQEINPSVVQISLEFELHYDEVEREGNIEAYRLANPSHYSCTEKIFKEIRYVLSIIHYFTMNEIEIKCWMIRYGSTIVDAAGRKETNLSR